MDFSKRSNRFSQVQSMLGNPSGNTKIRNAISQEFPQRHFPLIVKFYLSEQNVFTDSFRQSEYFHLRDESQLREELC